MSDRKSWQDLWPTKAREISKKDWELLPESDRAIVRGLLYRREYARTGSRRRALEVSRSPEIRASRDEPRFVFTKPQLAYRPKPDLIIDALYPNRLELWKAYPKRRLSASVSLGELSFLDNPHETIRQLQSLLKSECTHAPGTIDFSDTDVKDVSPYLLLAIMIPKLSDFAVGGEMSVPVQRILNAVGLTEHMGMMTHGGRDLRSVFSFPLQMLMPGSLESMDFSQQVSKREKVQRDFVDCVNEWLGALQPSFQLSEEAGNRLGDCIGEALDNAQRHASSDESGGWWITGFMSQRATEGGLKHMCHVGIVNEGISIGDSLLASPKENLNFWPLFNSYRARHGSFLSDETLATILAIQQGVSRKFGGADGGQGFPDLIEYIGILGAGKGASALGITIVSGSVCIRVCNAYITPTIDDQYRRLQWFNREQDWKVRPDSEHVLELPIKFPGTILGIRFELDPNHLSSISGGANE